MNSVPSYMMVCCFIEYLFALFNGKQIWLNCYWYPISYMTDMPNAIIITGKAAVLGLKPIVHCNLKSNHLMTIFLAWIK